jgi:hypothetical protein
MGLAMGGVNIGITSTRADMLGSVLLPYKAAIQACASAMLICILYGRVMMWLAGCAGHELLMLQELSDAMLCWQ